MTAMQVMSALSQPTRLDVFTRLVSALPGGMAAGDLAAASNAAPSAMSAHLAILARAGLVKSTKTGRSIVYSAIIDPVTELRDFLDQACRTKEVGRRQAAAVQTKIDKGE